MSGWFSRAKEALGGRAAPPEPEPIELPCPCGRKVEALRREKFQRVLCKTCGEPFFVLPFDVYPRPVLKRPRPAKQKQPASPAKSEKPSVAETPAKPAVDVKVVLQKAAVRMRSLFTPLRVIVVSLLIVIGGTGWWQWGRAARSLAEVDFKAALDEGQDKLQKKEFATADIAFAKAASAADVLERHDHHAEQARQWHRELTAINSQLQRTPIEILKTASETAKTAGPAAAESEFLNLNSGRWVVLHSEISPSAAGGSVTPWEQRVQLGTDSLIMTASLSVFGKVTGSTVAVPASLLPMPNEVVVAPATAVAFVNDLGQREVLFAAQVESLRWDATASAWRLTLKPESGFLWVNFDLLSAAGLTPDELRTEAQLKSLLADQARWMGVIE